ncbi:hypothetical protein BV394_01605 [Brevirhabdus pacifica]|uniref:Uncharacterized protein n=3 Tax=Brevirhabdus pacifica TaxID=1267768 RepID=A0A1U7DF35_9RHOB|nr:hypothetical protein BV394_01605 [Brevirhabdus pacifica]PJJ86928.1 sugar/nucleoside kinase (ribokinase family) [Brevirhabdus pacifica]
MLCDILCLGAAHWDVIGHGTGNVVRGADLPGRVKRRPGGVALNLALAMSEVSARSVGLLAAVGDDAEGQALVAHCTAQGITTDGILRLSGHATDSYVAIEDPDGLVCAIADTGTQLAAGTRILAPLEHGTFSGVAVIDGNLAPEVLLRALEHLALARICLVAASPAKASRLANLTAAGALPHATLYANLAEAAAICGETFDDSTAAARALVGAGFGRAVVTDGPRLAADCAEGRETATLCPPPFSAGARVTGAGDRFAAAHITAVLDGRDPVRALGQAIAAAGQVTDQAHEASTHVTAPTLKKGRTDV